MDTDVDIIGDNDDEVRSMSMSTCRAQCDSTQEKPMLVVCLTKEMGGGGACDDKERKT